MARKDDPEWARAKRLCRLSAEDVRKAKELGFRPRGLIKNIPSQQQKWKAPVHIWIRDLYERRQEKLGKKVVRFPAPPPPPPPLPPRPPEEPPDAWLKDVFAEEYPELLWDDEDENAPPTLTEIDDEDRKMLRRQRDFRTAAEWLARAFGELPQVEKVVLFGSVAVPLRKEVPRFRKFRRARQPIWHECKDVDLAVWVSDLGNLKQLQLARGRTLNRLFSVREIGVAHHQADFFLMEPGTDRYLGRLCGFGVCPKGKPECRVPGCGASLFLQQHEDFQFRQEALGKDRIVVLFDRAQPRTLPGPRDDDVFLVLDDDFDRDAPF